MARVGQARKRDANEAQIVADLRAFGAEVMRISGPGLPDLFVEYRGRWTPLEVKSHTGGLTPLQAERATSGRPPIPIVRTTAEALRAIKCHGGRGKSER